MSVIKDENQNYIWVFVRDGNCLVLFSGFDTNILS